MAAASYPYRGEPSWQAAIESALSSVIDPEMALNIVDLGLVYGVDAGKDRVAVHLTMTSAACPVAELIVDDTVAAVGRAVGADIPIDVDLVWEPPWTPEHMSRRARHLMGWD